MPDKSDNKLRLGKGATFFVKSQLLRLSQQDETWDADFFPIPCSDAEHGSVWWGLVLSLNSLHKSEAHAEQGAATIGPDRHKWSCRSDLRQPRADPHPL